MKFDMCLIKIRKYKVFGFTVFQFLLAFFTKFNGLSQAAADNRRNYALPPVEETLSLFVPAAATCVAVGRGFELNLTLRSFGGAWSPGAEFTDLWLAEKEMYASLEKCKLQATVLRSEARQHYTHVQARFTGTLLCLPSIKETPQSKEWRMLHNCQLVSGDFSLRTARGQHLGKYKFLGLSPVDQN